MNSRTSSRRSLEWSRRTVVVPLLLSIAFVRNAALGATDAHIDHSVVSAASAFDELTPLHQEDQKQSHIRRRTTENGGDCILANTDLILPLRPRDIPFASSLFKSIEFHLPCFNDLVVIVPPESKTALQEVLPKWARAFIVPQPLPAPYEYLSEQVIKVYADKFTTAENVFILESDIIFTGWQNDCFFGSDGTILLFCSPFEEGQPDPVWRKGTEHALWRSVDHDCQHNKPYIFPRETFSRLRMWIREVHSKSFEEVVQEYYEQRPTNEGGWTTEEKLFSEIDMLNHFMIQFMEGKTTTVKSTDPQWAMAGQCAQRFGR